MAKKKQKKQQTGQQFLSPEQFMKQRARSLEIAKISKRCIFEGFKNLKKAQTLVRLDTN